MNWSDHTSPKHPMGKLLSLLGGKALHMSHERSTFHTGSYEAGRVRLDFGGKGMGMHGAQVVRLDAWRSGACRRGDAELVATGVGFKFPLGESFQLKLAKLRDAIGLAPITDVALVNAQSACDCNLRLEMLDDIGVGHKQHYGPTHMCRHIESINHQCTIREMETIGVRIRERRKELGLNQVELAARIGVNQSTISDIENGASFEATTLMKLSKALALSPTQIMTGENDALRLSAKEVAVVMAMRTPDQTEEKKPPALKKTVDAKAVSSPLSKPKGKRRIA